VKNTVSQVRGNETAIRQILINLISNAVKYNRDGGKVLISCHDTSESVEISIKDEGNGIGCEDLVRIFEKFYRTVEGKLQKGAGLGLYIVKHLAEAMGGKVMVISQPGLGSTFTVSFIKTEAAVHNSAQNLA
jgi:signal transduction histidine kinase